MSQVERSIRVRNAKSSVHSSAQEEQAQHSVDASTRGKVDRLKTLRDKISELKKRHKETLSVMEKEAKEIEKELLALAQDQSLPKITGEQFVAEFSPTVTREIDPRKLLHFMKENGTQNLYFEYITCPITKAVKDMGEKVLLEKQVLTVHSKPFSSIKINDKSVV